LAGAVVGRIYKCEQLINFVVFHENVLCTDVLGTMLDTKIAKPPQNDESTITQSSQAAEVPNHLKTVRIRQP
jgi:hypothetical protein